MYIIGIDQSTQSTKAFVFGEKGALVAYKAIPHKQIISESGWISHNLNEIYENVLLSIKEVVGKADIDKEKIEGIGISSQRETAAVWNKTTGEPVSNAVVWQCARAKDICGRATVKGAADAIFSKTGIPLSPYFSAAKYTWLLENACGGMKQADICFGTIDSWLIYKLTGGESYKTDYSNASRTQLFNIFELRWDEEICALFGVHPQNLPAVCPSDACYGYTDFGGFLKKPIPIHAVLGDSHAALFGQGCLSAGMTKVTYGTGSSIMMNIGEKPVLSGNGLITSVAWHLNGKVNYVIEGNLNYVGAVITWLKDDLGLIQMVEEVEGLCENAPLNDSLYIVPAFSGLGAPYWDTEARAVITGMNRSTNRAAIVRSAVECIAYQIADVLAAMNVDTGTTIKKIRADGAPSRNRFLMRFQSNIANITVEIADSAEMSGIGAAYAAGIALNLWRSDICGGLTSAVFEPALDDKVREAKYNGWKKAVTKSFSIRI
jgi:glycerol kinase